MKKKQPPKTRNTYVRPMDERHKNTTTRMKDRRVSRSDDAKNHWLNEWELDGYEND